MAETEKLLRISDEKEVMMMEEMYVLYVLVLHDCYFW